MMTTRPTHPAKARRTLRGCVAAVLCLCFSGCCQTAPSPTATAAPPAPWPADIEAVLASAGDNRPQLERVLEHYKAAADPQKLEAACFLIRHMPGHGFVQTQWLDPQQRDVPFDALAHRNLREASAALEKLEASHGKVRWGVKENRLDVRVIGSAYLIDHIDRAFAVYRGRPWCRDLSFELFCDFILPYRATNEPLNNWRGACEIEAEKVLARMTDPTSIREAEAAVTALSPYKVGFNDLYYLNPTDQGFDEMVRKPVGRCEDQQTMRVYVLRANGIPVAGDFTPYWATRDNNHAWEALLDEKGFGRIGLSHVPAKIYRKTFSHDPDGLSARAGGDAGLPRRLVSSAYRDVTEQYVRAREVPVDLTIDPPARQRFAYLCVFNGGQWRIIHWGEIAGGKASFDRMGYGVVYLPVYFDGKKELPAAAPLSVSAVDGSIVTLQADALAMDRLKAALVTKLTAAEPAGELKLMAWTDRWQPLAEGLSPEQAKEIVPMLPEKHLYWIVGPRDAGTARIFTVAEGRAQWW